MKIQGKIWSIQICILLIVFTLLLNGCDDDLKKENADLKAKIDALSTAKATLDIEQAKLKTQFDDIQSQLTDSKAKDADLSEKFIEIQKENASIKEELENTKGQLDVLQAFKKEADLQKANDAVTESNKKSAELNSFLSVARRMIVACETGITYNDFESKLIDLKAGAEEVVPSIKDPTEASQISDFVSSLDDLYSMWTYTSKIDASPVLSIIPEDRLFFTATPKDDSYILNPPQGLGARAIEETSFNNNWKINSADLVKKYQLPVVVWTGRYVLSLSVIVPKILNYAENKLKEIDTYTQK